ncbi:MAG TPA: hypothetical protein VFS21_03400 [Roseiflexaceae bacterium]|nr:hypothetical protein [Roseiflexaceae bacterium]
MTFIARFREWFSRQSGVVKVLTILGSVIGSGLAVCCCSVFALAATTPRSATPVAGRSPTSAAVAASGGTAAPAASTAAPAATVAPEPTAEPPTPTPLADRVKRATRLLKDPSILGSEEIGQVCDGDAVTVLSALQGTVVLYYRVRVDAEAGDCEGRVAAGTEGWLTSSDVDLQTVAAAAIPSATPTPSPTPTNTPTPTATPSDPEKTATIVAYDTAYPEVDIRDLAKAPDRYEGQKFRLEGEVFNIEESGGETFLQMWVQIPGGDRLDREAVAVRFNSDLPGVFAESYIIVYGVGRGAFEGTNAMGATIRQPLVEAELVRF